jgi:hypothetical protein
VLINFLREHIDVFAWKPDDMPDVPWELIEHSLNISATAKPIKQKLRRFTQDKKEAIRVEITRLLATSFIKEVYHPEWLANLVLVRRRIKNEECALVTPISTNTALKTPSAYLALTRS